jgi:branched-chain amino acid transport system permease protein
LLSKGFDVDLGHGVAFDVAAKPVWLSFLAGILLAALFGWLVGKLAFRVRGAYFVILTVSFAQVMRLIALNWVDLTEGPMAINNIPSFTLWLPGLGVTTLTSKAQNYWLILAVAVISFILVAHIVNSRVGRALVALRENEGLARSVGIPVTHYLVLSTITAAAIAGAAGGLYTHYVRIVDPDVFAFIYTVTMIIMVVTGGKGTLVGPVVGGLIFGLMPEVLRDYARPEVQWIIYGIAIVLIVFFLPQGIVPATVSLWQKVLRAGSRFVPERLRPRLS